LTKVKLHWNHYPKISTRKFNSLKNLIELLSSTARDVQKTNYH